MIAQTVVKKLTLADLNSVKAMKTNIENDYVIDIFERLVTSDNQAVYGLYSDNQLISIAGYTLFPGGYAMLGRLRSDIRVHGKGFATELLRYLIDHLKQDPTIVWIGANTNIKNNSARRVLKKLGFNEFKTLHGLPLIKPEKVLGAKGPIWSEIQDLREKRTVLDLLSQNSLDVYPYECYYPFPFRQALLTDDDLHHTSFYHNPSRDRWLLIKKDFKKELYAQVKYFWNDHFIQPGFFETIAAYIERDKEQPRAWIDFTPEGYQKIPDLSVFELSDGWVLYGEWV